MSDPIEVFNSDIIHIQCTYCWQHQYCPDTFWPMSAINRTPQHWHRQLWGTCPLDFQQLNCSVWPTASWYFQTFVFCDSRCGTVIQSRLHELCSVLFRVIYVLQKFHGKFCAVLTPDPECQDLVSPGSSAMKCPTVQRSRVFVQQSHCGSLWCHADVHSTESWLHSSTDIKQSVRSRSRPYKTTRCSGPNRKFILSILWAPLSPIECSLS